MALSVAFSQPKVILQQTVGAQYRLEDSVDFVVGRPNDRFEYNSYTPAVISFISSLLYNTV